MSETILRTEKFEIEVTWGHSLYFAELDQNGKPVKAIYLDWKDLATVRSQQTDKRQGQNNGLAVA